MRWPIPRPSSRPEDEPAATGLDDGRFTIDLGATCSNRCIFCAAGNRREVDGPPSAEEIAAAIASAAGVESLAMVGGEPTLHPELSSWIEQARALGCQTVTVQTNGRRLSYRGYARRLVAAGVDTFDISLHGPRPEVHDHHTRVPGSFEQTLRGIKEAISAGAAVGVTTVVTRSNFRNLEQTVDLLAHNGVRSIQIGVAQPRGEALTFFDRIIPRLELIRSVLPSTLVAGVRTGIDLFVSGVPLCAAPEHAVHLIRLKRGPAHPRSVAGEIPAEPAPPEDIGISACRRCAWWSWCDGLHPEYLARYGAGELLAARSALPREARAPSIARVEAARPFCGIGLGAAGRRRGGMGG